MNKEREMINISYFDKEELSLAEHTEIYYKLKKDILDAVKKYPIEYLIADTEIIRDYKKENKKLKQQNEFLMKKDNVLQSLKQWLNDEILDIKTMYSQINGNYFNMNYKIEDYEKILSKIEELEGE